MSLKQIEANTLTFNPFEKLSKQWALVSAGSLDKFNMMTVSWGAVGVIWGKPSATVYIRHSRYTKEFVDAGDTFVLTFLKDGHRDALNTLGSKSGRDMDKMHQSGLTPIVLDGQHAFDEAHTVLVCRTLYSDWVDPARFRDPAVFETSYPDAQDVHRIYVAEVCSAFVRK